MDVELILNELRQSDGYAGQIVHIRTDAACQASYARPREALTEPAGRMLAARGIDADKLYSHQAMAIDAVRAGQNPLVVTGTASGKSMCYILPLIEMLAQDPAVTAMLLFPTKALSQDQHLNLVRALDAAGLAGVVAGVFDGDTPAATRRKLRDTGRVIITNPDMLHAGLMPQHVRWSRFLSKLRLIVIDELHTYSGIIGSGMANVNKRLDRLLAHYGASPQYVACSATMGNPLELATALVGRDFMLIDNDGSPKGRRSYVFWNPPRIRETVARGRRSANVEAYELMAHLVARGIRTITFAKAKMAAELIVRYVQADLLRRAPHLASKVAAYRGGYLPEERRELERRLFTGELMGVVATRALELGIDVGGLDASILVGYPGTLAGFFQQTGRAGRTTADSLAILVGLDTAVNQYVMSHPEYLFGRQMDNAVIEPENAVLAMGHLRCAAQELPMGDEEVSGFGSAAPTAIQILEENRKLSLVAGKWYHAAKELPQHEVSLRAYSDASITIQDRDTGAVIGQLDKHHAPPIIHPEAIYMHQGDTYRVEELDMLRRLCYVRRVEVDYYTQPLGGTDVHHIDNMLRRKPFGSGEACWGEVTAHFQLGAYEKVRFFELDAISVHPVDLPLHQLDTQAIWLVPPESFMKGVREAGLDVMSGLKGIGFATRMMLPLFITCDTLDFSHSVGTIVNSPWQAVFIYERYPLGLGFTAKAYDMLDVVLPAVLDNLAKCRCTDGCPCCVGKPLRGELVWNVERGEATVPSKAAARLILEGYLGDGTRLSCPEEILRADLPERTLRRRLERSREPWVQHPITRSPELGYPDPEAASMLEIPDAERRGEHRRDFNKALRRRIAESGKDGVMFAQGDAQSLRSDDPSPRGEGPSNQLPHPSARRPSLSEVQSPAQPSTPEPSTPESSMSAPRGDESTRPSPQASSEKPDDIAARARRMRKRSKE